MNLLSLFEAEKNNGPSKLSKTAAIIRCEQFVENHHQLTDEQKMQIGRMPLGTKQTVSYSVRNGAYVYCLRSKFGGGRSV